MDAAFQIVVLGCTGGPRENNLSGYLFSPLDTQQWIALDAGSLMCGIDIALAKNSLQDVPFTDPLLTQTGEMHAHHLKAYLLSHAHLDHISGLVLNSQADSKKYILGTDSTINDLKNHIFNNRIWPNYGNEGSDPILGLYTYLRLELHKRQHIPDTNLTVEPFVLSHPHNYASTAFLIEYKGKYIVYFGDTASDQFESERHLNTIWERIAPLIRQNVLHGLLLECSFPHRDAKQVVYGHLDTHLMMQELHRLQEKAQVPLKGLKVLVTHRKECLKQGIDSLLKIQQELTSSNDLGISFFFPTQGDRFTF
jgi:cAMP phosphodiesterase